LDPTVMAGDAVVSIVMAAAATEAFINELESVYRTTMAYLRASEIATSAALAEVEKGQGSTELKYLVASLSLSGQMFDRGGQPFQDFSLLMRMRNDLMHAKPRDSLERVSDDRDEADGEAAWVTVPPSYVRQFEQRAMTVPRGRSVSVSWLNLLETEHIASWACAAAVNIIVAIVNMEPADSHLRLSGRAWAEHYHPRAQVDAPWRHARAVTRCPRHEGSARRERSSLASTTANREPRHRAVLQVPVGSTRIDTRRARYLAS